jgi:hypothetical protein
VVVYFSGSGQVPEFAKTACKALEAVDEIELVGGVEPPPHRHCSLKRLEQAAIR